MPKCPTRKENRHEIKLQREDTSRYPTRGIEPQPLKTKTQKIKREAQSRKRARIITKIKNRFKEGSRHIPRNRRTKTKEERIAQFETLLIGKLM